jgi:hypothetical protein
MAGPADSTLLTREAKKSSAKFGGAAMRGRGSPSRVFDMPRHYNLKAPEIVVLQIVAFLARRIAVLVVYYFHLVIFGS